MGAHSTKEGTPTIQNGKYNDYFRKDLSVQ